MRTLVTLSLTIATALGGETIIPLKSGDTELFSYGLGCLISDSKNASDIPYGNDLILTLRNTGAKWIKMEGVTAEDFNIQDAKGKELEHYLSALPEGLAYNQATTIHLKVKRTENTPTPWTLHFKSKPKAFVPFDLKIDGIDPSKSPSLDQQRPKGQQSPIIDLITGAREFRSKHNDNLTKSTSDEALNLLNRFADTFKSSERDCRVPEQGPKAALEPVHVVSFITPANENASVELYVFSETHSVLQISIDSKVKKFFLSTDKELIGQFSKVMQKK